MSNFNTNINADDVMKEIEKANKPKTVYTSFDPKNYLNVKLDKNENSKKLVIRLLPIDSSGGFPFQKVKMHTIKVNKEVSENGWKTFPCPVHNHLGDSCPLCEVANEAIKMQSEAKNDGEKNKLKAIERANKANTMYIVRCIERGHEEDGVKFWLMSGSKDGPYNKIMNLWSSRWQMAKDMGEESNIFDLNNGKDLYITITRSSDSKTVYSVVDSERRTPLTTDFELGNKWINDSKKWTDVYRVKPREYMEILMDGDKPIFDKEQNKYVGKYATQQAHDEESKQSTEEEDYTNYESMPTEEQIKNGGVFINDEIDDLPY